MHRALFMALVLAGCADEDRLRAALPAGAQDAERVFMHKRSFSFRPCNVAAYRPQRPVLLGAGFAFSPIKDAVGEMSVLIRIIGDAEEGCTSPAGFGFSRHGYYDFISSPGIQYKWKGHEVIIFDSVAGLFWVLRA